MISKRKIPILILILFVSVACSREEPRSVKEVGITEQEVAQSVGLSVGDTLEVTLSANPSTGYAWEAGFYNESVLKPVGEPEFIQTEAGLGKEGLQKLHFEAIGEGETELRLIYRRPFEKDIPEIKTFSLAVVVK